MSSFDWDIAIQVLAYGCMKYREDQLHTIVSSVSLNQFLRSSALWKVEVSRYFPTAKLAGSCNEVALRYDSLNAQGQICHPSEITHFKWSVCKKMWTDLIDSSHGVYLGAYCIGSGTAKWRLWCYNLKLILQFEQLSERKRETISDPNDANIAWSAAARVLRLKVGLANFCQLWALVECVPFPRCCLLWKL